MAKIVYACGDRTGADSQLKRFLEQNSCHEIKVAAYLKSSHSQTHIDWTLNALGHPYIRNNRSELKGLLGKDNIPAVGVEELMILTEEIGEFNPDLVICDFEPIISNIAHALGFPLWYCSPVHLYDGVNWEYGQLRYNGLLAKTKQTLLRLPEPDRKLVYSPFGDLKFGPKLKPGYEWVRPYYHSSDNQSEVTLAVINDLDRLPILSRLLNCVPSITLFSPFQYELSDLESFSIYEVSKYEFVLGNSKWAFLTGETSYLSDLLYRETARVAIAPNLEDPEELLNAALCRAYFLGDDLGQVEHLKKYATEAVNKSITLSNMSSVDYLDVKDNISNLTERIQCDL